MGRPSLEGVDLKLNRAIDRFETLVNASNEFGEDPDSKLIVVEDHSEPPGIVLRVKEVRRPPPEIALLIGECVQQYRSALDHLAFQLLIANTRGRIPARLVKRSEFPIFNSGPRFRGKLNRKGQPLAGSGLAKIEGIREDAARAIEQLQPYHRWKHPRTRILWQLQELSSIDKHRFPHVAQAIQRGSAMTVIKAHNIARLEGPGFKPGPFKRDAVVAEFKIVPADSRYGVQMNVKPELLTDIAFGKGSQARSVRGKSVTVTLYEIGAFIASDVLPPLTATLGLNSKFRPGRLTDAMDLSPDEREALSSGSVHKLSHA